VARRQKEDSVSASKRDVVKGYLERGFRIVTWPDKADWKGPREAGWIDKTYTIDDYKEGDRVGIVHGVELAPGKFLVDVDIDWGPGVEVAKALLPSTQMVWGRASKKVSHCLYLTPDVAPMYAYKDVGKDGVTLIEFRSDKHQSMAPPSVWEKDGKREALTFVVNKEPAFVQSASFLKQRACLSAIGMILAKHLGRNGFGHDPRLAWAGFLLRAGIPVEDLVAMGNAISVCCNNLEVGDVRRVVESTATALASDGKKVKGGPALAKILGEHGKAVINRINEWIGRDSDFVRVDGVIVRDHQQNIRRAVERLGKQLTYNAFSDKMLVDDVPLEDRQMNDMWLSIDEEFRFRPTFMFFEKVVHRIAHDNPFHPVKQYLASLAWDERPRLDTWLVDCAGAEDNDYTRAVSAIVLIAAVRRIAQPGAKYDELLVLEGAQGLNKSSALRALCPHNDWFSDDLPLNTTSQRIIESTLGKWIIEAADLAGRKKAEIEHLKATLSRQIDGPARLAYARLPVERPRQFIVVGTTNSAAYLPDPTGARRFWPVAIKAFDVARVVGIRDQLWAEAAHREAQGESIRLPERLWPEAAKRQEKRREVDPWESAIRVALLSIEPSSDNRRRLSTDSLWDALGIAVDKRDRYGAIRIAEIMHRLGFKRTTVRDGDAIKAGYVTDDPSRLEVEEDAREPGEDDEVGRVGGMIVDKNVPF
jgi:hypothetical protein